jgi:hypothetical protein
MVAPAVVLLAVCAVLPVPPWVARKMVHMGIGTLLVIADPASPYFSSCIYAGGAAAIFGVSVPPSTSGNANSIIGPYAKHRDVGIMGYTFSCCMCVWLGISLCDIAPLFYADPAGAIVGRSMTALSNRYKYISNPKLFGTMKTLAGTAAVAFVGFMSSFIGQERQLASRVVLSLTIAALELFGDEFDNPLIGIFLISTAALSGNKRS